MEDLKVNLLRYGSQQDDLPGGFPSSLNEGTLHVPHISGFFNGNGHEVNQEMRHPIIDHLLESDSPERARRVAEKAGIIPLKQICRQFVPGQ
jgi:hypothetical protein